MKTVLVSVAQLCPGMGRSCPCQLGTVCVHFDQSVSAAHLWLTIPCGDMREPQEGSAERDPRPISDRGCGGVVILKEVEWCRWSQVQEADVRSACRTRRQLSPFPATSAQIA